MSTAMIRTTMDTAMVGVNSNCCGGGRRNGRSDAATGNVGCIEEIFPRKKKDTRFGETRHPPVNHTGRPRIHKQKLPFRENVLPLQPVASIPARGVFHGSAATLPERSPAPLKPERQYQHKAAALPARIRIASALSSNYKLNASRVHAASNNLFLLFTN